MCIRDSLYTRQCSLGVTALQLSIAAGTIANGGVNPVSYTHLDVYKRQVLTIGLIIKIVLSILFLSKFLQRYTFIVVIRWK